MKVKQTVKHFALLSMITFGISACSSTVDVEEQPATVPEVVEPVIEEAPIEEPKEVISAVINNGVIDIPVLEDAKVFAEFSDELPAVINYFTQSSEDEAIAFYTKAFGDIQSQERKRGRLTLKFSEGDELMRVVISPQNNKRQVDVIIESKK